MAWGYHLAVDGKKGQGVTNPLNIRQFLDDLLAQIDMEPYGEPFLEHIIAPEEKEAGYTLCQVITTSTITGHFVDRTGDFYIDIFSCKYFNELTARSVIHNYFKPVDLQSSFIERG